MQETLSSNTQNKIILITGATSGIGYALSEIYLKNNWIVIGLGRDKNKIEKFFILTRGLGIFPLVISESLVPLPPNN